MTPGDERPHPPGDHAWWGEAWDFDFATADGGLGGFVRLGLLPNQGTCWYWACVTGAGRDLTMVVDHEVPLPGRRESLEVRAHGLWADHIVETPLDHVSVGCEAFALRFDDPAAALAPAASLVGEPVPFGLDLGWETDAPARVEAGGYALPCCVVGEVLVADERILLDAPGWRRHTWGVQDWWSTPRHHVRGRLNNGTWIYEPLSTSPYRLDPVADVPILAPDGSGRTTCVARDLVLVTDDTTGVSGGGWTESTR